jgi:hypothetical protein
MYRQFRYAAILTALPGFGMVARAEIRVPADDAMKAATKKTAPDYPPVARRLTSPENAMLTP